MAGDSLRYALIALDVADGDKSANLEALEQRLKCLPYGTDIAVVPELFTTGFAGDKDSMIELSETILGNTVDQLKRLAKQYTIALCGTFLARVGGELLNRCFFIEPNGDDTYYDKRHLFSISSESKILHQGSHHSPIIRYRGWSISMIVCYDLRFPVWCRNVDNAYDLMIVPANWPSSREYAWSTLLKARAIENQAYYLACNRSGHDKWGDYPLNMTMAIDSHGRPLNSQQLGDCTLVGELSKDDLNECRRRFPFYRDADSFNL